MNCSLRLWPVGFHPVKVQHLTSPTQQKILEQCIYGVQRGLECHLLYTVNKYGKIMHS